MEIGRALQALVESARTSVLLVAPFMRADPVADLMHRCPDGVPITCVTRWRPEEVLQGVSDLEVADVVRARDNARLLLRPDLHAKLYRADGAALVGSANLTRRALGWARYPNLELLVPVPASDPAVAAFERTLLDGRCSQQCRATIQSAVDAMRRAGWTPPPWTGEGESAEVGEGAAEASRASSVDASRWIPLCRTPDRLYSAYRGDHGDMTLNNYRDATQDLAALGVPAGLNRSAFRTAVASALSQKPVVHAVDDFVRGRDRYSREVAGLLEPFIVPGDAIENPAEAWTTLKEWLLCFFPDRYRRSLTEDGEVFQSGRVIGEWSR